MEKINIAELLKDCPRGMELNCTMFDDNCMEFNDIVDNKFLPIRCRVKQSNGEYNFYNFTKYGCWINDDKAKCVIFPKAKTTWEGFHRPFKDGDILAMDDTVYIYNGIEELSPYPSHYVYVIADKNGLFAINTSTKKYGTRFATEDEKQKLFDAIKANGYKWNPETKTLEKLVEPKFKIDDVVIWKYNVKTPKIIKKVQQANDGNFNYWIEGKGCIPGWCREDELQKFDKFNINTLVPFEDKVLIRNDENQRWLPAFWGYKVVDGFITTFGWCKYCIPYKGNENLFKTNNDCDDFYKTWEE